MTWKLMVITFRRWKMCTCGFQQRRDVVAWLHCQAYKFCLISHLWSWWQNAYIGDIRTTCNLDHVKRYLHETDQSVIELPADDSILEAMPTDLSPQEDLCWVLKAWWTQTHKSLIWLCRRISAYRLDQAPSDVSPEGSMPAMCPATSSQQRYLWTERMAPDLYCQWLIWLIWLYIMGLTVSSCCAVNCDCPLLILRGGKCSVCLFVSAFCSTILSVYAWM